MRSANSVESPPVRGRHPERKRGTSLKLVEEIAESLTVCAVRDDGMEAEEESSEGVRTCIARQGSRVACPIPLARRCLMTRRISRDPKSLFAIPQRSHSGARAFDWA